MSVDLTAFERVEAALGDGLLNLMRRVLRWRLSVKVHEHRDAQGRVTPWLEFGRPGRGTLVWLHGFSDRPDGFLRTALHLADDFRIVAPAMPAFHEGWRDPDETHTVTAYGDWVGPVVREAAGPGPFVLIGNSLGGAVALEIASRMPSGLTAVVAVNAAGMRVDGVPSVIDEMARGESPFEVRQRADVTALFTRILGRPVRIPFPFLGSLFREYHRELDWYARLARDVNESKPKLNGDGWDAAVDLHAIAAPALVLWGERDTFFPQAHAEKMAEGLPKGRLQWLERAGHSPHVDKPERLASALRAFAEAVFTARSDSESLDVPETPRSEAVSAQQ